MPAVRIKFTDDATQQERAKTVFLKWFEGSDRDRACRKALDIMATWRGISNIVVVATMIDGDAEWVPFVENANG